MAHIKRILRKDKAMILAFDQGLEHGPKMFDLHTIDPEHIMNIALEGDFTAVALHPGVAEKYYKGAYHDVPLIVKLNGHTDLSHINPVSRQFCSVERAIKLSADAVGYTIYDGSPAEPSMFQEFGKVVEQAHDYGVPVVAWMYPRGPGVVEDSDSIAYAARVGLELGADFVKVKYNKNAPGFDWIVKSAGRSKVLLSDFEHSSTEELLQHVHNTMKAGATGVAFGRTIWQHPRPFTLTRALQGIVMNGKKPEDVKQFFD